MRFLLLEKKNEYFKRVTWILLCTYMCIASITYFKLLGMLFSCNDRILLIWLGLWKHCSIYHRLIVSLILCLKQVGWSARSTDLAHLKFCCNLLSSSTYYELCLTLLVTLLSVSLRNSISVIPRSATLLQPNAGRWSSIESLAVRRCGKVTD
jgi:purine-cytosine permease-like protein